LIKSSFKWYWYWLYITTNILDVLHAVHWYDLKSFLFEASLFEYQEKWGALKSMFYFTFPQTFAMNFPKFLQKAIKTKNSQYATKNGVLITGYTILYTFYLFTWLYIWFILRTWNTYDYIFYYSCLSQSLAYSFKLN